MRSTVVERDPRTRDEILHRPRDEDLTRSRERRDAVRDVHADAANIAISQLHLPGVHAGADLDIEYPHPVADVSCGVDAGRRTHEGGEHTVAGRLDEPAAGLSYPLGDHGIVLVEHRPPAPVTHRR